MCVKDVRIRVITSHITFINLELSHHNRVDMMPSECTPANELKINYCSNVRIPSTGVLIRSQNLRIL